jgi:chromosome segregation ATPase
MASELQAKLNEKQTKCEEIEHQFKELKRSVAKNAVFSRTNKPLSTRMINDWEATDEAKDSEVHQYRLQNIQLRNQLANCEKVLKKKEQLADGLHLIDFEQLKIENQTLNEKIEERNEELSKLSWKIRTAVIIVSHTREKLQYVRK